MSSESTGIKRFLTENLDRYRPIPFWAWNDRLEREELCRQIDWMHENHIGGFFMHARSGLQTEYLSDEWMDSIAVCADRAAELGMDAWAYDENGWPSGFAGGKLLEDPENRDQYILSSSGAFDPAATVSYFCDIDELIRTDRAEGDRPCLNLFIHTSVSNADILNKGVVEKFIALTHEEYKARFGADFSRKIRGFFTDEPQYQRSHTPYTKMLEGYFRDKYRTDILDELGLLFLEKKGYRQFRYRYWCAMQDLMLHSFAETIYRWCLENNVAFTGHYVDENCFGGQVMCCGGVMPFYEYMTMPGIDWLDRPADNELPVRQLASVAAQLGKEQTVTETFGCCGWEISPKHCKRIADFQYLNGVSVMCHHLIPYSEHGLRKDDYPAHYSPVNPWVRYEFAPFNLYYTRLGKLIGQSTERLNVAVLQPVRSAYFDYKREEADFGVKGLDDSFRRHCRLLSASGVCYHLLDEVLLRRHGFVKGARIGCGKCEYDYLVLADAVTMDRTTEALLRDYCEQGGRVLILGGKPTFLEGEPYDYSYLSSNCTLEELCAAQPFAVAAPDDRLYYTCRETDGVEFMMIQNASVTESAAQTLFFGDGIRSLRKLDLFTLEETNIPLSFTLEPGESMLVFPDTRLPDARSARTEYTVKLQNAAVDFEENMLVVDYLRFSYDGVNFSKPYPHAGLFQKLLEERYEGELYLKYEFEIRTAPSRLILNAEDCRAAELKLNGRSFVFTDRSPYEKQLLRADVTSLCRTGVNEFTMRLHWHQDESVHYALFGENVTESLKNCVVYDTELQPVFLSGDFGVYSDTPYRAGADEEYLYGDGFYIGERPAAVSEPVTDGFPFFAGRLSVKQRVTFDSPDIRLRLNGNWHIAYIKVNGRPAGKLIYGNTLDIAEYAVRGENLLEIDLIIGNRNLLGPHHYCGSDENFTANPERFELTGSWEDGQSKLYADRYNLIKVM